jgi:chromosomal replication initiation ATPase DnaA
VVNSPRAIVQRLQHAGAFSVVQAIAAEHGMTTLKLVSRLRYRSIFRARAHALCVLRHTTLWSYPELGRLFSLDHTSIMHAVGQHEAELERVHGASP